MERSRHDGRLAVGARDGRFDAGGGVVGGEGVGDGGMVGGGGDDVVDAVAVGAYSVKRRSSVQAICGAMPELRSRGTRDPTGHSRRMDEPPP